MNVKKGDIIICCSEFDGNEKIRGVVGRVVGRNMRQQIPIEFFAHVGGHSCISSNSSDCKNGYGWWVLDKYFIPAILKRKIITI